MTRKDRSLKARLRSFVFAARGLRQVFAQEPNAAIHLVAAVVVIVAGFLLELSNAEFAMIVIAIAMVFAAEVFNTAIERLTDLVSPTEHPLAGQSKDMAAGAVLIASIAAVIIGAIVFIPKLLPLIQGG